MNDKGLLARMRAQYQYATLERHMLADGILHLRCGLCRVHPVPHCACFVLWCDPCLDEYLGNRDGESLEEFVARKQADSTVSLNCIRE